MTPIRKLYGQNGTIFQCTREVTKTVVVNEVSTIPEFVAEAVFYLSKANRRIQAIKFVRDYTKAHNEHGAFGLKESKDFVEYIDNLSSVNGVSAITG